MDGCYEVKNRDLKAIGFEGLISSALNCIKNGSLTIVMQDNHAIQINRCERYILKEYKGEIDSIEEVWENEGN